MGEHIGAWVKRLRPAVNPGEPTCTRETVRRATDQVGDQPVAWAVRVAADIVQGGAFTDLTGAGLKGAQVMRSAIESIVISTLLAIEADGHPPAQLPPEAEAQIVDLVHRRVPLDLILTHQRRIHSQLADHFMGGCRSLVSLPDLAASLEHVSHVLFEFADTFATMSAESYTAENERFLRSTAAARYETVLALLAGEGSVDVASRQLTYPLTNAYHIGLVLHPATSPSHTGDHLDQVARSLLRSIGANAQLVVPVDRTEAWAWGAFRARPPRETPLLPGGSDVLVGMASPHRGVQGFRCTHEEALDAARVGALGVRSTADANVVRYDEVRLLSLLIADPEKAARFVRDELGVLGSSAGSTRVLRRTVRVYLDCHGSPQEAARELQVAKNTVIYRVKRAEELLGRSVRDSQLELHAALRLAELLPDLDDTGH
ncbi:PucR family transcriptional regulator [Streptomyces sp. NPDC058457]|uniref:PucR family transcriptional regulator n=1 Tax=Streptomyces sp. NPDC058457 TaxID=3346507 RepID=UPI0036502B88